jgi:hypothetical protein
LGTSQTADLSSPDSFGGSLIVDFWAGVVQMFKIAFQIGFFWANATAVYLLVRRATDAVEMDEVAEVEGAETREAPSLAPDELGIPTVRNDDKLGDDKLGDDE